MRKLDIFDLLPLVGILSLGALGEFLSNTDKTVNQRTGQNCQISENTEMAKKKGLENTEAATLNKGAFMDAAAFRALQGERYTGLNILKLQPGQGAGPLEIVKILPNQDLGSTGKKKKKPVDVYCAKDADGIELRLPVAQSLTQKLKDAKVGVGDKIAILRGEDYVSKTYGNKGASFELTVLSRASGSKSK